MTTELTDPRLTAVLLHELSAQEERELLDDVESSEITSHELRELSAAVAGLTHYFSSEEAPLELAGEQLAAVQCALARLDDSPRPEKAADRERWAAPRTAALWALTQGWQARCLAPLETAYEWSARPRVGAALVTSCAALAVVLLVALQESRPWQPLRQAPAAADSEIALRQQLARGARALARSKPPVPETAPVVETAEAAVPAVAAARELPLPQLLSGPRQPRLPKGNTARGTVLVDCALNAVGQPIDCQITRGLSKAVDQSVLQMLRARRYAAPSSASAARQVLRFQFKIDIR